MVPLQRARARSPPLINRLATHRNAVPSSFTRSLSYGAAAPFGRPRLSPPALLGPPRLSPPARPSAECRPE
eukprot:5040881-Alexandrium_andersonii.AAC.1